VAGTAARLPTQPNDACAKLGYVPLEHGIPAVLDRNRG
jgi:hypothetical protein